MFTGERDTGWPEVPGVSVNRDTSFALTGSLVGQGILSVSAVSRVVGCR